VVFSLVKDEHDVEGIKGELIEVFSGTFCGLAAVRHGILTTCIHCELVPITLVYYTDPVYLDRLRHYVTCPTSTTPTTLRQAY